MFRISFTSCCISIGGIRISDALGSRRRQTIRGRKMAKEHEVVSINKQKSKVFSKSLFISPTWLRETPGLHLSIVKISVLFLIGVAGTNVMHLVLSGAHVMRGY